MRTGRDDFLPNCIFTWASATREYERIDKTKGWDKENIIRATFCVLKLLPLIGNATFLGQKLWCAYCAKIDEKAQRVSQKCFQGPPDTGKGFPSTGNGPPNRDVVIKATVKNDEQKINLPGELPSDTIIKEKKVIESQEIPVDALDNGVRNLTKEGSDSDDVDQLIQKMPTNDVVTVSDSDGLGGTTVASLNTNQKETLELLHKHSAVFISEVDLSDENALKNELKNHVYRPGTIFLAVNKQELEEWEKGRRSSDFNLIPKLWFFEIRGNDKIHCPGYLATISEDGKFIIPGAASIKEKGPHSSIEELYAAHLNIRGEQPHTLKAPILKEILRKELETLELPEELVKHSCFEGRFLNVDDFREWDKESYETNRKDTYGRIFYSMESECYFVNTPIAPVPFKYINGKIQSNIFPKITSLDEWLKRVNAYFVDE